ncbi:unnamed protein product [Anisakis simplex]|uniref:Putative neutral sphingomyelinase (inferred by orthology to a C. elegans protein) n=1 Tax=Anisakis simplex TaxID=6269 RepID=A0A0M3K5B6_ANISI|nr:unnamed protein product [Anisakis simplex]
MAVRLRVITLNCWALPQPWPIGSSDRQYRLEKLCEALVSTEYDVISLQEVSDCDFNLQPEDLGYRLIVDNADLTDAWLVRPNENDCGTGMTCDRPDNCYTPSGLKQPNPDGKRLDYIMFKSGKSDIDLEFCENRLDRIPGDKPVNYSDHLGVYAEFKIHHQHEKVPQIYCSVGEKKENANDCYQNSNKTSESTEGLIANGFIEGRCHEKEKQEHWITSTLLLKESIRIAGEGEKRARWDRRLFLGVCLVLFAVLVATINVEIYIPDWSALVGNSAGIVGGGEFDRDGSNLQATAFRFLLTLVIGFCLWYGIIGLTMELKALKAAKSSMAMLLND